MIVSRLIVQAMQECAITPRLSCREL